MAKQLNVNLSFTADTAAAKKQIQDLQNSLQAVAKMPSKSGNMFGDLGIQKASEAALELQQHLQAAVNVNTGKLDLSRFSTSLKASGKDLSTYSKQLMSVGEEGQQAFLQLARSISTAEAPVTRVNAKLAEMGTVLKNTARWQISSSILHGFMGSIQSAYGYAQDLNESLNNIRIVTGQTTDQMSKFAEEANKSAKALSTTTTAYTDAALIFYQQGLGDKEVKARTDAVIKMANVTGDSATDVSSYMTAIWNNFAKGSDNLEHFADVITALGASTASSSSEIAAGLEKFASIGDTIGLSYDYATSILASLVANTRQSADVIGTALRSIFARLQGLSLGETLEDGVDLNKYSKALKVVGVDILDVSGQMKDANTILDETAAKWDTLSRAQQTALAQTVAGTRQYAQFVAMMENWDDVQTNLQTAANSDGTLQEQADIYAESWEAARDRVKAAAEGIYNDLLNDDFFIGFNNDLATVLESIDSIIDSMGGLKGIISTVGGVFLTVYAQKIPGALENLKQNLLVISGQSKKVMVEVQNQLTSSLNNIQQNPNLSNALKAQAEGIARVTAMQQKLILSSKNLSDQEKFAYQLRMQNVESIYQQVAALEQEIQKKKENAAESAKQIANNSVNNFRGTLNQFSDTVIKKDDYVDQQQIANQEGNVELYDKLSEKIATLDVQETELQNKINAVKNAIGLQDQAFDELTDRIINNTASQKDLISFQNQLEKAIRKQIQTYIELATQYDIIDKAQDDLESKQNFWKNTDLSIQEVKEDMRQTVAQLEALNEQYDLGMDTSTFEIFKQAIDQENISLEELGQSFEDNVHIAAENAFKAILDDTGNLNLSIDAAIQKLRELGLDAKEIATIQGNVNGVVDAQVNRNNLRREGARQSSAIPGGTGDTRAASVKIAQYASSMMTVYSASQSLISSGKEFIKILNGEGSALGLVSSLISTGITGMMAFSTVTNMAAAAGISLATAFAEILIPLALITGAIVGITYLIKEAKAASPEGQLKSAKEEAAAAADALENAKTAAEGLKSSFDDYDSVVEKLHDCTKGTQEWYDALNDVNNKVLELIQKYPELVDENFVSTNEEDGVLTISDTGRQSITDKYNKQVRTAQSVAILANQNVREEDIEKQASSLVINQQVKTGIQQGSVDGKLLSSLISSGQDEKVKDYLKTIFPESDDGGRQLILDGLKSSSESLDSFVKAVEENTIATKVENETLAKTALSENDKIQNSKYRDDIYNASGRFYNNFVNNPLTEFTASGLYGWSEANDEAVKKIWSKYLEAGGTGTLRSSDAIKHEDGKWNFYRDDDTKISLDQINDAIAISEANERLAASAEDLIKLFTDLDASGKDYDQAIKDILVSDNFENSTRNEVTDLQNQIESSGGIGSFAEEHWEEYGYKSAEVMAEAWSEGLINYNTAFEDAGKNALSKSITDIFNNMDLDSASITGKETIAELLEDAYINNGKEAAQELANLLDDNVEDVDAFAKALDGVEWDIVDDLKKVMAEAGVATDLTDEEWQQLAATLYRSQPAIADATEGYKSLHDVINDFNAGDTISAEDYEVLGGDLYESFFLKMADGTYKLTTDAQSFYDIINRESVEGFKDNIATIQRIQNAGYSNEDLQSSAMNINDDGSYETNSNGVATFDSSKIQAQLDLLEALNGKTKETRELRDDLESGTDLTIQRIDNVSESLQTAIGKYGDLDTILQQNQEQLASTAEDLDELHKMYDEGAISAEAFTKAAMAMDATEDLEGLDTDKLKDYADYLQDAAKGMDNFNDSMSDSEAQIVAKGIMKMNSAIETLADNFVKSSDDADSWIDILKKSEETSQEYADAMIGTKNAVADLLDISSEYVSNDFIKDHLDEINEASTGSAEAIDNLKTALSSSVADTLADSLSTSESAAKALREELQGLIDDSLAFDDLEVGASLYLDGQDGFVAALNDMIAATGMTVDQVNALCDSMGFEANFASEDQDVGGTITEKTTHHTIQNFEENDGARSWDEVETTEMREVPYEGTAKAFSMTTDGSAPKVNSVTKKASGSSNNYSSSNPGGKSKPGKSSKSGSKSKSKDEKDPIKDLPDAYHDVNRAIKQVEDSLSKLDKKQSHLYGKELIASLQQENALLQQQAQNYEWMGQVIESEKSRIQGLLGQYGVVFDSQTGEILNYTEAYIAAVNAYNAAIAAFNASAQEDADKKALEQAKKAYDEFKSLLSEYESTLDKQMKNEQDKLDNLYKQIENNFKAWETEIQVTLDLSEAKQEWEKFWQKVNKDIKATYKDYMKELGNLSKNFNLRSNDISTDIKAIQDIQNDIDSGSIGKEGSKFASETEAANALLEYSNTLREDAESLYDIYEDAWNEYLDGIDQVVDRWSDLIDEFDDINDSIEHHAKVIELLYKDGDMAKQLNGQVYEVANQNNLARMDILRQSTAALEKEREELLAMGKKETDKDVKALTDAIKENQKEMESAIESYLEGLTNQFQNSVAIAMKEMEKGLSGGSSYSAVTQQWEDAQYAAKGYYDDVERIYQLESMESKWKAAINSSSTLKNQQKLKELMDEQLKSLESKTKLTEYDIELAEKQLAVAQAQMALEDAQNNKNSMKLVRNEQGNWAYQYVADEDDVASKQQALLDANNEWYEFTKQSWQDLTEEIWNDIQTVQERLTALMEEYNTADEARREEIKAEYDYLYEYYYGEDGLIATKSAAAAEYQDNLNEAMMNHLWGLYEIDEANYEQMTDKEKDLIDGLREHGVDQYQLLRDAVSGDGGVYDEMYDKCVDVNRESLNTWKTNASTIIQEWAKNPDSVQKTVQNAYKACEDAQRLFDKAVEAGVRASGIEYTKLDTQLDKTAGKIENATDKTNELLQETDKISEMAFRVQELENQWLQVAAAIQAATADLENYLAILTGGGSGGGGNTGGGSSPSPSNSSGALGAGGGDGGSGDAVANAETVAGIAASIWMTSAAGWGNDPVRSGKVTEKFSAETASAVQSYINAHGPNGDIYKQYHGQDLSQYYYSAFDTGGYTGEWYGNNGKFAMLHSKELVLNAEDTANMLEAVNAVRSIAGLGTSVASSIAAGVSNMVKSLLGVNESTRFDGIGASNSTGDTNEFHITAEFPNAENVEEIREAIMSLPTLASQYLSQNKL